MQQLGKNLSVQATTIGLCLLVCMYACQSSLKSPKYLSDIHSSKTVKCSRSSSMVLLCYGFFKFPQYAPLTYSDLLSYHLLAIAVFLAMGQTLMHV